VAAHALPEDGDVGTAADDAVDLAVADEDLAAVTGAVDAHHRFVPFLAERRWRRRATAASRRISSRRIVANWIVWWGCMGPTYARTGPVIRST
jgi:hypothetical protein